MLQQCNSLNTKVLEVSNRTV